MAQPESFADLAALAERRREPLLHASIMNDIHPVRFEPGSIEFRLGDAAPKDLPSRLAQELQTWTGRRWIVAVSDEQGEPTLRDQAETARAEAQAEAQAAAADDPVVRQVMETFPGATIREVGPTTQPAPRDDRPNDVHNGDETP
jgi:DNA polymerase-3 subunit gamma/tau